MKRPSSAAACRCCPALRVATARLKANEASSSRGAAVAALAGAGAGRSELGGGGGGKSDLAGLLASGGRAGGAFRSRVDSLRDQVWPASSTIGDRPSRRNSTRPSSTCTRVVRRSSTLTENVVPMSSSSPSGSFRKSGRLPGPLATWIHSSPRSSRTSSRDPSETLDQDAASLASTTLAGGAEAKANDS